MQVILDSSFARPGSAPIWGGKKGEFRDWTGLLEKKRGSYIGSQTTLKEQDRLSLKVAFLSKFMFNYVVLVVSGYWARFPDTGQHSSSAKILISRRIRR